MNHISREQLERARSLRTNSPQNFTRPAWYRLQNVSTDLAEVYIYDEIGYFGVTADDLIRDVSAVNASELAIHVNSRGGDVFEALAIHAFISDFPGKVTAIIDGVAASAASFLIAGADTVKIRRNASMMIHDAHLGAFGNEDAIRAAADLVAMASDNISDIYHQLAPNKTAAEWRAVMKSGDTWYTSAQALEEGLAHEIIDNSQKSDTAGNTLQTNKTPRVATATAKESAAPAFDYAALMDGLKGVLT